MTGLTNYGEEYLLEMTFNYVETGRGFEVGLYNSDVDTLTDTSVLSDITSEPSGSTYHRQTISESGGISSNGSVYGINDEGDVYRVAPSSFNSTEELYDYSGTAKHVAVMQDNMEVHILGISTDGEAEIVTSHGDPEISNSQIATLGHTSISDTVVSESSPEDVAYFYEYGSSGDKEITILHKPGWVSRYDASSLSGAPRQLDFFNGAFYALTDSNELVKINAETGEEEWVYTSGYNGSQLSGIASVDSNIYGFFESGDIYTLNPFDGSMDSLQGSVPQSGAMEVEAEKDNTAEFTIFAVQVNGNLYALDSDFNQRWMDEGGAYGNIQFPSNAGEVGSVFVVDESASTIISFACSDGTLEDSISTLYTKLASTVAIQETVQFDVSIQDTDSVLSFNDQTFDVRDSTEDVDSYFVTKEYQSQYASDVDGEAVQGKYILFHGSLEETASLEPRETFTLKNFGFTLD